MFKQNMRPKYFNKVSIWAAHALQFVVNTFFASFNRLLMIIMANKQAELRSTFCILSLCVNRMVTTLNSITAYSKDLLF